MFSARVFATEVKDPDKNPVEFPSDDTKFICPPATIACQVLALFAALFAKFTVNAIAVALVFPTYFNFKVPYSNVSKDIDPT